MGPKEKKVRDFQQELHGDLRRGKRGEGRNARMGIGRGAFPWSVA